MVNQPEARQSPTSSEPGVLDAFLWEVAAYSPSAGREEMSGFAGFRQGGLSVEQALTMLFGDFRQSIRAQGFAHWKKEIRSELNYLLAQIDQLVNSQLNAVIHHPRFQRLEASWRGLKMLCQAARAERSKSPSTILVRMLSVSWSELHRDFEKAVEFDGSQLFRKVYEDEFGTPGGIPYSVMVGDYEIHPRPTAEHPIDDLAVLGHIAGVAAAAFCPFVCSAAPSMFGADSFHDLQSIRDLQDGFGLAEFVKWRSLRRLEDARFVGLALPRILMRVPYSLEQTDGFSFTEEVSGPDSSRYLWGNAAFAWACVLIRAFAETSWLADIRGTERNRVGGGLVTNLPRADYATDPRGVGKRSSTDVIITDSQESELSQLGFLPLCQCHDTEYCAFFSSPSIQQPKVYDDPYATGNARLTSMLHYILCVSRFAHYLKVLARDELGGGMSASDLQDKLDGWIKQYVTPNEDAKPESKAKRPLRSAEIEVAPNPASPGSYQLIFRLLPHYQLDGLTAAIKLQTSAVATAAL
ncbi:MAG: type VI secretion system contractile sheath large subunit [Pirellulaceae bacterium]|nr:type VI secretion system contractile sheath large subunit [Pirellulaceae bacterium]